MIWTGKLCLTAEVKKGKTIIRNSYYEGALKLSRPVFLDETSPTFFLIHVGGGYVGGDRYRQEFCLEEDAELTLTTQAATKVYKTTTKPAKQETEIILKKGSFLTYVQDPLIAYEHAQYIQETTIQMESGAGLMLTDLFTPGWSRSEREFTYDWIRSKMNVSYNGKRLLVDHLLLQPSDQLDSILMLEGYTHFGSLLFIHENLTEATIKELQEVLIGINEEVRIGISRLPVQGLLIRILGSQTQQIEKVFSVCETLFRKHVLRKEAIFYRKY
jgi:urease accessory protein